MVEREKGKAARTGLRLLERFGSHALVEALPRTGRAHQIRAHLAHLGHPVAGDTQYGGEAAAVPGLSRHFLHAWKVGLEAPGGGRVDVESPLPPELERFLAALR